MRNGLPVIGFVGPSSTGKTALLEQLVPALENRGLSVGVVKHSCHDVCTDQPGKDSARLYAAGAHAVALAAQNQIATFVRRDTPPRLADALASLPAGLDIVLVEGFSWEPIPRYRVQPEGSTPGDAHQDHGPLLGTIVVRANRKRGEPLFPPHVVEGLIRDIASLAGRDAVALSGASPQE
jgi:molybdopterin-guanine dinucleotide biosynthesis protein MobB